MMGDDGEMEMGKLSWEMMRDGEMIGDDGNRGTSARLREGSAPGASASAPRRRFKPKKKKKNGMGEARKESGGREERRTDGRTDEPAYRAPLLPRLHPPTNFSPVPLGSPLPPSGSGLREAAGSDSGAGSEVTHRKAVREPGAAMQTLQGARGARRARGKRLTCSAAERNQRPCRIGPSFWPCLSSSSARGGQ